MQSFHTTRQVAHSAEEMFRLVADVERYPEFVPLCEALGVRRREDAGAREVVIAEMTIAYKFVRESFTTRVVVDRPGGYIQVEYLDGPFRHLDNRWTFRPMGDQACEIDFFIAYEFRSRTLQLLMGGLFDKVFRKFVSAFEARADDVYGRATTATARITAS